MYIIPGYYKNASNIIKIFVLQIFWFKINKVCRGKKKIFKYIYFIRTAGSWYDRISWKYYFRSISGKNAKVVINVKNVLENSERAKVIAASDGHTWTSTENGVQVAEDNGKTWTTTNWGGLNNITPALQFKVNISNAGDYYLRANMSNPNDSADSYHVAVDGVYKYVATRGMNPAGEERNQQLGEKSWYLNVNGGKQAVNLTEGEHTLTIFAREDGLTLLICIFPRINFNGKYPRYRIGEISKIRIEATKNYKN